MRKKKEEVKDVMSCDEEEEEAGLVITSLTRFITRLTGHSDTAGCELAVRYDDLMTTEVMIRWTRMTGGPHAFRKSMEKECEDHSASSSSILSPTAVRN